MASHNLSWFLNAFSDLQSDLLVSTKLKELKVALTGLPSTQRSSLANSLPLKILFDCLNTLEKKQIQMSCDVLKMVLSAMPPLVMYQQYEVELARALKHPEKCVKETILFELSRLEGERDIELLLSKRPRFINEILELLQDEDLSVAQVAVDLLTKIGNTDCGFAAFLSRDTNEFIQVLNDAGAVHALRIYQVMLEIGVRSEDKLSRLEIGGLLRGFGQLLTSEDILAKMAAIEELSKLVDTPHGYRFLSRQNCIHLLSKELVDGHKSPLSNIVTPGLLKFFGCACHLHAEEIHKEYPQVLDAMVSSIYSTDLTISTTALEAVGFICTSSQGKLLLNLSGGDSMMKVLKKVDEVLQSGQVEWKHRVLYALAGMLHVDERDRDRDEVLSLTQKWFSYLDNGRGTSLLINLSRNPFPEVKLAAFHVISKLATLKWGQAELYKSPGGLDYLLDRSTETAMAAVVSKFEIITALADSESTALVLSETDLCRIKDYRNQGATYVPSKLYVAVEGAE